MIYCYKKPYNKSAKQCGKRLVLKDLSTKIGFLRLYILKEHNAIA